ncbi:MAG: adenosylcobinamide amidohydrolase [Clostridiales bacterium]
MKYPIVLKTNDQLNKTQKALIVHFGGERKVFSTSIANGGIKNNLKSIFNYDLRDEKGICELHQATYKDELIAIAAELALDPNTTTGMSTAVGMGDAAIKAGSVKGLTVYAIVTAGIENNGGAAGDPCSYTEGETGFEKLNGTINIMVLINADLDDGILCRAAVTATEAKTAAIGELRLPSLYSAEIATGSGTDGLIIAVDPHSEIKLTDAGQHSLLGELIGKTVKLGVRDALLKHMSETDTDMRKMGNRLKRLGITSAGFQVYCYQNDVSEDVAESIWAKVQSDEKYGLEGSMVASFADDVRHNLINKRDALKMATEKLRLVGSFEPLDFDDLWYEYLIRMK